MEGLRPERSFMSLKDPLRALLYSIFLASPNIPEAEIIIPKYLYLVTHSISCPSKIKLSLIRHPVLLKIIIFVLFMFTVSIKYI
jgi:hypothetical protein